MKLRCVCCGNVLSEEEAESSGFPLEALSCYDCREEVIIEQPVVIATWPEGWYGHCSRNKMDRFFTWEEQGGV